MKASTTLKCFGWCLVRTISTVIVLVGLSAGSLSAQHPPPINDNDWAEANAHVFLEDEVTGIYVTMDPSDLHDFINDPHIDIYADCTVRIVNSTLDETLQNVGIRPRGNSQRNSKKFPWKLDFNEFVPGRKFHGVEKMNLASESTDPTMSRETLAYEVFRSAGVATPRTNYVWLTINDGSRIQGVYNNIEQVDEEFTQAWFGSKTGDLYKCRWKEAGANLVWIFPGDAATYENLKDYEEKITGSFQRLADFIDFINNTDDQTFNAGIGDWINVDSFLRAQGVDMLLGQWDGIWIFPNNYYLYWDIDTQRFEYIPWDVDHCMGMDYFWIPYFFGTDWARRNFVGWGLNSAASVGGGNGPPLIDRLLKIPEYENQLAHYVKNFAAFDGHPAKLATSIKRIFNLLEPLAYSGTFSGSTMENDYSHQDFLSGWDSPADYTAFNIPATFGVRPFLNIRSKFVRDQYPDPQHLPPVSVNEALSSNVNGIVDEAGEFEDWVELHNESNQPIDVGGFFLSDRYADPSMWEIPAGTVIPPFGYILIWCDNEIAQGNLHANFKLDSDGEGAYLFAPINGFNLLVSSLVIPALGDDESWGRVPDGGLNTHIFTYPTPGSPNQTGSFDLVVEGYVPDYQVLHAIGATPSNRVAFVWSGKSGNFVIGGSTCSGISLDLGPPVSLGAVKTANLNGIASVTIPPDTAFSGILVQCLDLATCGVSNLIQL